MIFDSIASTRAFGTINTKHLQSLDMIVRVLRTSTYFVHTLSIIVDTYQIYIYDIITINLIQLLNYECELRRIPDYLKEQAGTARCDSRHRFPATQT